MATLDELQAEIEQLRGMLAAIAKGDELKAKAAGIRIGSLRIYEELVAAGDARLYQQEKDGSKTDLTGAGTGGAPKDAKYLVGAAHADLSDEIDVGLTPGGELGGTWPSPTVDATHSGSAHHTAVTLAADADVLLGLSTQQLTLDSQDANKVLAGPATGAAADPTFRVLVDADIPAAIARDAEIVPAVEAEATLDLTGAVTIAAGKSLATDTIAEKTATAGVTIDGSTIKDFVFYPDPTGHSTATVGCVGANFYFSYDGNNYIILFGATPKWSMAVGGNAILELLATTIDAKTHKIVNLAAATANGDAMRFDETPKLAGDLEGTVAAPTVKAASLTVAGKVEIATAAETTTGTDAGRAVSPDGLAGSDYGKRIMYIHEVVAAATALTTGDSKATFAIPIEITGWNLVRAEARVHTVGTGATLIAIQIRNVTDGHDMLSTKITIDASELTSYTAATPSVVDTNEDDVVTADIIAIDIDAINNTVVALGLDVILTWQLP
jgi:hypothetical protein